MARSLSSQKRLRQNRTRAARNRARVTTIKTRVRKLQDALKAQDAGGAEQALRQAAKLLDRYADRGTIHRNTAARRKSRLAKRVNALKAAAAAK